MSDEYAFEDIFKKAVERIKLIFEEVMNFVPAFVKAVRNAAELWFSPEGRRLFRLAYRHKSWRTRKKTVKRLVKKRLLIFKVATYSNI